MSYEVTWSEGTMERLRTAFSNLEPSHRHEWLIDRVIEYVEQEIALYPQDAMAQPGQRIAGQLRVSGFCVHYEIHMDTGTAMITAVESHAKPGEV